MEVKEEVQEEEEEEMSAEEEGCSWVPSEDRETEVSSTMSPY